MSQAVIFLGGDQTDLSRVKQYVDKDTLLIGCDGGTKHILRLGLHPDVIIGDLDSLPDVPDGAKVVKYPADKDFTDSELAINYAKKAGRGQIILAGVLGSRFDHLLGNVLLLKKRRFGALDIKLIEGNQEIYLIRGQTRISGNKGDVVSFIPISGNVIAKSCRGLKYNLTRYRLSQQGNRGISNIMTGKVAEVNIGNHSLLVIHQISS